MDDDLQFLVDFFNDKNTFSRRSLWREVPRWTKSAFDFNRLDRGMKMNFSKQTRNLRNREAPLEIHGDEFRKLGHQLVDEIAEFLDGLPQRPVTTEESPQAIRKLLDIDILPERGLPANDLLDGVTDLLFDHSLFNGHPRFWGYITSSAADCW